MFREFIIFLYMSMHSVILVVASAILGVYPFEYMDDWEKFSETSLHEKAVYSYLNRGDIAGADYFLLKK